MEKEMRIIDLLNNMSNGAILPKVIEFDEKIWKLETGKLNCSYIDDLGNNLSINVSNNHLDFTINNNVETIDDKCNKDTYVNLTENELIKLFGKEYATIDELLNKIDELSYELENLKFEMNDLINDVETNYRRIPDCDLYEIYDHDFI